MGTEPALTEVEEWFLEQGGYSLEDVGGDGPISETDVLLGAPINPDSIPDELIS